MTKLAWDSLGERLYETGVDHGVLYIPDEAGAYTDGVAWNGLTTVTETPSGAAGNAQYADNIKYLNLFSAEEFGGTIEALTFPDEFAQYDGLAVPTPGLLIGQQSRKPFGLSYRTMLGNDLEGNDYGYKLHLMYGVSASPSEKAYGTVNDTPAPIAFSWAITTTPIAVTGMKPTSLITIDSTKVGATQLAALETILYGSDGVDPALPFPDAIVTMFEGSVTTVHPTAPTYVSGTHTLTIPTVAGLKYYIDGAEVAAGDIVITKDTLVVARPTPGNVVAAGEDNDWFFGYSA
jgi:hypothetical protein